MQDRSDPGSTRRFLALPPLLALAVHATGLGHALIGDDLLIILGNPDITGPGGIRNVLLSDWFARGGSGQIGYYRPVVKASFRLTYLLGGASPFLFHLGNVLIHALAALALALVVRRLAGRRAAMVAASLWVVHPMTVQAVQAVAARSDLLATAFFLLSTLAFLQACDGSRIALATSAAAAALAIGSKESVVLLPLVLVAAAAVCRVPLRRALALAAVPAAAMAAVLAVRLAVVRIAPIQNPLAELPWGQRLLCVLKALGAYVKPLVLGEAIVRLPQAAGGPLDAGVVLGALVLACGAAILVVSRLRSPASFAVVLTGTSLAPALAVWMLLIPMWRREIPVAERWLYLPVAGVCLLAALAVVRLPRPLLAGVPLVAVLAGVSLLRIPAYASAGAYVRFLSEAFASGGPPRNPREAYLLCASRGDARFEAGDFAGALAEYRRVDALAPALAGHVLRMARSAVEVGEADAAAAWAERLLDPGYRDSPALATIRRDFGDDTNARIPPAAPWEILGLARARQGRLAEARRAFEEAERRATTEADRLRIGAERRRALPTGP